MLIWCSVNCIYANHKKQRDTGFNFCSNTCSRSHTRASSTTWQSTRSYEAKGFSATRSRSCSAASPRCPTRARIGSNAHCGTESRDVFYRPVRRL
jgi:hypothetical protein